MDYDVRTLPVDDITTLLNFYYDYQKSRAYPTQVKEFAQGRGFNYYLDGKQYLFYSEDAIKIVEDLIVGKNEPKGVVERMKDKIVKKEEHEKELLNFTIKNLYERLNKFFESRLF